MMATGHMVVDRDERDDVRMYGGLCRPGDVLMYPDVPRDSLLIDDDVVCGGMRECMAGSLACAAHAYGAL